MYERNLIKIIGKKGYGRIISEYKYKNRMGFSLRTKNSKYIIHFRNNKIFNEKLYNLKNDPGELENLINIETSKKNELKNKIMEHYNLEKKLQSYN